VITINLLHKKIIRRKKQYSSFGSKRSDRLNELIKYIKMVKLNSLQDLLMRNIWRSRTSELGELSKLHFLECILDLIFESTPTISSLMLLGVSYSQNGKIDPEFAFTIIGKYFFSFRDNFNPY
jgi:ABC-type multidrug transport system fused ATPase/permease subunit